MRKLLDTLLAYRKIAIVATHVALVVSSYLMAVLLRFEFDFPARDSGVLLAALPVLIVCRLVFFSRYELFSGWWQYVGVRDVVDIVKSTTAGTLAFVFVVVLTGAFSGFPRSLWVLEWLLTLQFLAGARVGSRLLRSLALRIRMPARGNVLIVGSGPRAESTLRELNENPSGRRPVGFLDDGSLPVRSRLRGLPWLGSIQDLSRVLREQSIAEVFVAVSSDQRDRIRNIVRECRAAGVTFKLLPSVQEYLDRPRNLDLASLEQLFDVEDVPRDDRVGRALISRKTILILGAGGQIGTALASDIASLHPGHLILLDRNESALYYLEVDFLKRAQMVRVTPVIADLRDVERLRDVVMLHKPDVVIHAAGYTRTDLLPDNRDEVHENNLITVSNALEVCDELRVPRLFVLSGDEAHRGELACLHRAAEHLVRRHAGRGFVRAAVRFPSVLGSPGCVVTRAARALHTGTPIEVAVPDARVRMVSLRSVTALLLEAFAAARDGDVLAIDLGKPQSLPEAVRYLRQVWNLPEVPFHRFRQAEGHGHPVEGATTTTHPRVLRRTVVSAPPCANELLVAWSRNEVKGGKLLESSSSR